ncbi:hypothetical protein D3C72_1574630 [compost metagenome]
MKRHGLQKLQHARRHFAVVDGQHAQPLGAVLFQQTVELRHLQAAGRAIAGPEVQDERRSCIAGQAAQLAVQGERLQLRPGLARGPGGQLAHCTRVQILRRLHLAAHQRGREPGSSAAQLLQAAAAVQQGGSHGLRPVWRR